jgi:broad specificity phosphatase PhoE
MTAVAVLPVDRVVDRLARLEQQQKQLGLVNHGYGIRAAITAVQAMSAAEAWHVDPPPAEAAVIAAMVASLLRPPAPP